MKDQVRTPLRTVLRNFLNHIEKLESSSCPEKSYDAEFQDLKLFSESVKSLKEYACAEGEKETNKKKNRYKDILPFDVSRVILNEYAGIPGSDYINANYIKGASGSPAYIASQGPLPCTVNDFWRMVVQCEVQVIVMACNEEEAGKAKCEKYWVDEGEEKQFGMISVKLLKASTVCPDFSVRTMRLKYTNSQNVIEERTVCQLHYVAWPDHGVPSVVQPLLEMVRLVRDTQASETLPVLVHCSAGCGRTGTICAIDYVWGLLRTGKLTDDFSLLSLIREMRRQRIAMVQTKEQYVLVHQAVRELFKEQLLMIDSHPYENVDPDGLLIMKEEENHYDTVEHFSSLNFEEKKDNTMEKDVAPPLPQKKHTFYPSKQEKDVENLSAQQRSITHSAKKKSHNAPPPGVRSPQRTDVCAESAQKPFHQLLQKKLSNPIPSKGILRVPHLRSINSSSPIKRSKSLKLTNSAFKQKLTVSSDIPVELKRRGSLESNIDEAGCIMGDNSYNNVSAEDLTTTNSDVISSPSHNSPHTTQKYDMLNYLEEKRLLVRSLTTFDMRQKSVAPSAPIDDTIVGHTPTSRCRLSRSNTQVDFTRHFQGIASSKKIRSNDGSGTGRKYNATEQSPLAVFNSKRDEIVPKLLERSHKPVMKDRMDDIQYVHQSGTRSDGRHLSRPSVLQKASIKLTPHLRGEVSAHLIGQSKKNPEPLPCNGNVNKRLHLDPRLPPNFRAMGSNHPTHSYETKPAGLSNDGKNPRFPESLYSNYASPSTSRHFDGLKSKTVINKHSTPQQYHNGMSIINDGHQKFSYLNGSSLVSPLKYDYRTNKPIDKSESKNIFPVQGKDCFVPNQPRKLDVSTGNAHPEYCGGPRGNPKASAPPVPMYTFHEKTAIVRKQLEQNNSRLMNKRGNYSSRDNEGRYSVDRSPNQQTVNKSILEVDHPKLSNSQSSRVWPSPYRLSEQSTDRSSGELNDESCSMKTHSDLSPQKNIVQSSGKLDMALQSDSTLKSCDYFSNAPGVDIDRVAASIPQKDASKTNLMKVALEAFSIRRSRQQARLPDSSPSASSSSKGSSPSSTMGGCKKKQQQYL